MEKLPAILLRENVTKAIVNSMNIRTKLICKINDCECVSDDMDLFCFDFDGTPPYHIITFQI